MDYTPVLKIFRLVAMEFQGLPDDTVEEWIALCVPLVSRKRFNNLYHQALALLTAHRMKLANANIDPNEDPLNDVNEIGVGNIMRVASYSEGQTSVSFNNNISQYTDTDAELALTPYGVQFLSLRRMRVMPITSAGENYGRA